TMSHRIALFAVALGSGCCSNARLHEEWIAGRDDTIVAHARHAVVSWARSLPRCSDEEIPAGKVRYEGRIFTSPLASMTQRLCSSKRCCNGYAPSYLAIADGKTRVAVRLDPLPAMMEGGLECEWHTVNETWSKMIVRATGTLRPRTPKHPS